VWTLERTDGAGLVIENGTVPGVLAALDVRDSVLTATTVAGAWPDAPIETGKTRILVGDAVESAADACGVRRRATVDVGQAVCVCDVLDVVGNAPVVLSAPGCLRAREVDSVEGRSYRPG
jgi:hypothetical protein